MNSLDVRSRALHTYVRGQQSSFVSRINVLSNSSVLFQSEVEGEQDDFYKNAHAD